MMAIAILELTPQSDLLLSLLPSLPAFLLFLPPVGNKGWANEVRGLREDRTNGSRTPYTRVVVGREGGREGGLSRGRFSRGSSRA